MTQTSHLTPLKIRVIHKSLNMDEIILIKIDIDVVLGNLALSTILSTILSLNNLLIFPFSSINIFSSSFNLKNLENVNLVEFCIGSSDECKQRFLEK